MPDDGLPSSTVCLELGVLRLRVLGECLIELGDQTYAPSSTHFFALLLRLGADAGRYQERAAVSRLLFPASSASQSAAHSMRQLFYLASTRGAVLERSSGAIRVAGGSVWSDYEEFIATDQASASAAIRRVDVLPDYVPTLGDEFTEWLDAFRQATQARIRHTLAAAMDPLRRRADWGRLEARAKELLSLDPLSETATLALAECLARTGSKGEAVSMLEAYRLEVETHDPRIAVPANVLRKRIERENREFEPSRQFSRFVGREQELISLQEDLAIARGGRATGTLILGDAGSGKSRLVEEYATLLAYGGGNTTVALRSSSTAALHAYSFLSTLALRLLEQRGAAGSDPHLRPFLDRLTGNVSPLPDPPQSLDDAATISAGMHTAVSDLLGAVAAENTTVIIVDDSRSIDDASLTVLSSLLRSAHNISFHLVLVISPTDSASRTSALRAHRIVLKPLPQAASHELLLSLADAPLLSDDQKQWCARVSGGNPTFLLLLAAECTYNTHLRRIPESILAAVDVSLGRLSPVCQRVLEACVALSDHCTPTLLTAVVGIDEYSLISALDELEQSGKIFGDRGIIHVRSDLIAERTRLRASQSVQAMIHSRAAVSLLQEADTPERPWLIIEHWRAAGQLWRAREELRAAWSRSLSLGQTAQAESSILSFLQAASNTQQKIELYEELIVATKAAGNFRTAIQAIDVRAELIRAGGARDPAEESMAFDRLDAALPLHDDPIDHISILRTYAASSTLDARRRARALTLLLMAADAEADSELARDTYDSFFATKQEFSPGAAQLLAGANLIYHSVFGELDSAAEIARDFLSRKDQQVFAWPEYRARTNAALALSITGDVATATSALVSLYEEIAAYRIQHALARTAAKIASMSFDAGDHTEARRWLREAEKHIPDITSDNLDVEFVSAKVDLALVDRDIPLAKQWLNTFSSSVHINRSSRFRMDCLAGNVRLAHLTGDTHSDGSLEPLLSWHLRARSLGRHDDCMQALWTCLCWAGRGQTASELLQDYLLRYRRERRPCRFWLKELTSADPCWENARLTSLR